MSSKKTQFLQNQIQSANGKAPADLVIKNGKVVDVFNLDIIDTDVAIKDGYIVALGSYEGTKTIDAKGQYIVPGLIDGHVHIESSMVTPREFEKVVIPHGVTTVIIDPHEIANVLGTEGISFMLEDSENLQLDVKVMLPSSVPATPFENSGATLEANDLAPFLKNERVFGLGEVMDYPSVWNGDQGMLEKISQTIVAGKIVDGHAAGLSSRELNVYKAAGITTDHECTTKEEALERVRRGMYVLVREGSVSKDLLNILPAITERNSRRFLFCTDDKHLDDLVEEGSIDHNIRLAIQHGCDPLLSIQMATLNAAECYGLQGKGAIAPGYKADFLLVEDLTSFSINSVYIAGMKAEEKGESIHSSSHASPPMSEGNSVHIPSLTKHDLHIPIEAKKPYAHIIEIIPNSLITNKKVEKINVVNEAFEISLENDQLKMAVIERHKQKGTIGLGIVKGFNLKEGAIATTIAHDSHNLVVVGTNDEDMLKAAEVLQSIKGGLVIIKDGEVSASLPLPIGGIMSSNTKEVLTGLAHIHDKLKAIGFSQSFNPFLTLSFLTLPVIPSLKLTDLGLFDVNKFTHIPVQANEKEDSNS